MTQQYPPPQPPQPYGPDPRQWQAYGQAPPPAPKKTRKWPWIVGGLFVLVFVLPALGGKSAPAPATPSTAAERTVNAVAAPTPQPEQETPAAETSGPKTSFGDGTWVVGEDIVSGVYKTTGAKEGLFEYCQITTHSDTEAESNFLDWKNGNANEPIRVKIAGKVKSVKATGCEDFVKVG